MPSGRMSRSLAARRSANITGSHIERAVAPSPLLRSVLRHDWNSQEVREAKTYAPKPSMCPLCGTVRSPNGHSLAFSNDLTGCCTAEKACAKRRKELDDETIEYLGLIPRKGTTP